MEKTDSNTLTNDLLASDWDDDKDGLQFSDIVLYIYDAILLIYTGWRSYDLISGTVPSGWEVMGFIALLALDVGSIIWTYLWMKNASNRWQNNIAMTIFWLDMAGVALTSITDSLLYGDADNVIFGLLEPVMMVVLPVIIFINVVAGIVYHQVSDKTKHERKERALRANARREEQAQREEELKLNFAQEKLLRRKKDLSRKVLLAKLKVEMDRVEKSTMEALNGTEKVQREALGIEGSDENQASMSKLEKILHDLEGMNMKENSSRHGEDKEDLLPTPQADGDEAVNPT